MVDLLLEYGYYIVGIGTAVIASIVSYFSGRKYVRDWRTEQKEELRKEIKGQVDRVIEKIDQGSEVFNQKFIATDQAVASSKSDIQDIEQDVKVLEKDFKSLCEKIGKHDYIVDKILPEYMDLKDSIYNFKSKIDENLLSNNDDSVTNNEDEYGK